MAVTFRSHLVRDLHDGSAGVAVRLVVCLAAAALLAGAAAFGAFVTGLIGTTNTPGGRTDVRVSDFMITVWLVIAAIVWVPLVGWVWYRATARWGWCWLAGFVTIAIGMAVASIGVLIEESYSGDSEVAFTGLMLLGLGGVMMTWLWAIRRGRQGRRRVDEHGKLNVACPTCGYSMVGLREAKCPECGSDYALDELLALQRFDGNALQNPTRANDAQQTASADGGRASATSTSTGQVPGVPVT